MVPSTVSAQITTFEEALEVKLLQRVGRNIEPTEMGQLVFQYADEIFSMGKELMNTVRGQSEVGRTPLRVGVVDALPKMIGRTHSSRIFCNLCKKKLIHSLDFCAMSHRVYPYKL